MKHLLSFLALAIFTFTAKSQNVGIGTTTPATILDVTSTTQGVLIPRVTQVQMLAIPTPANGLLVTNTDSANRIFIYTGAVNGWKGLSFGGQNVDTSLLVHKAGAENITGTKTFYRQILINYSPTEENMTVGLGLNTRNVIVGVQALASNTSSANDNIALGYYTLFSATTGSNNNGIGTAALVSTNGNYNNALGVDALGLTTTGDYNEAIGNEAGYTISGGADNTTSNQSIYLGAKTKALADNQTNQIVIGYDATGLGSNTAIIGNNATTTVGLNGNLRLVKGMGTAPATASSPGTLGDIVVTSTFIYVCTATNTWVRSALTTW